MILYDKTALVAKLGRKTAEQIEILLTPESDEEAVSNALERLMRMDTDRFIKKFGDEPPEIYVAAAVGFLRLHGGNDENAGAVAADNFNEAIRLDPGLDNDTLFRNDFIYELIKAGAEQGDTALMGILCDLYVGDIVAPGLGAHLEADGMTEERLREAIDRLCETERKGGTEAEALRVCGISPSQLKEELDGKPYEENGYALSRKFGQEGRMLLRDGKTDEAAAAFYKGAMLGGVENGAAYVSLTTGMFKDRDKKQQLRSAKAYKKASSRAEKAQINGEPAETVAAEFDTEVLKTNPMALLKRSRLLRNAADRQKSISLLEAAADGGSFEAQIEAADHYGMPDTFDFDKMFRFLIEGLVNPGSWYVYGRSGVPFSVRTQRDSARVWAEMTELFGKLCVYRDMIDELEELSEQKETNVPVLTPEQQKAVFMWFLCDPESDERREILARFYAAGFGTERDKDKADRIWKELCDKYAPDGVLTVPENDDAADGGPEEGEIPYIPCEAFYSRGLYLITAEGEERNTEAGKKLLGLIPESSPFSQKASKLLALCDTDTAELLKLGTMFHNEGNDGAMLKVYEAAEKLGDPAAARILGRYYMLPENGQDNEKALSHFAVGASRGDIQSMYFAGGVCQAAGDAAGALDYLKECSASGEYSGSEEDRSVAARAMRDIAEMYFSGAVTGEKEVPEYLYWMDRAERAGYKLSDAAVDKRRSAENYFKPAQWQELFAEAMETEDERYREWAVRACAERKITAAQEEYGVRLFKGEWTADGDFPAKSSGAYSYLKTPALSSPRAQYYAACALYLGCGCEKNVIKAADILPAAEEFGDPEQLRSEIEGLAAYEKAGELGERHAKEASELLKKAEGSLTAALNESGNNTVLFELSDILIRAYGVPGEYEDGPLKDLWRKGYSYLLSGYGKEGRCTARIDGLTPGRICEIAALFEGDNALSWYLLASERDAAAQYGAGAIYLDRARVKGSGKVTDKDAFEKAKDLISRAAAAENADAELAMYTERKLFETDTEEAKLFVKRSAIHGNEEAKAVCKELEIAY